MRHGILHGSIRRFARLLLAILILGVAVILVSALRNHAMLSRDADYSLALLATGIAYTARLQIGANDNDLPLAPLIAIVGCDGAGKSTLVADMKAEFGAVRRVEACYLGLGSGDLGERIKRLPLIGRRIERRLAAKAKQSRTRGERIPGIATALAIYGFSLLRRRRFRRMLALRRAGAMVIADRYPQTEVAGFYDGPGLSAARAGSRWVAWLAARERRMYEWMAGYRPDLVLRLNVDAATAFARKPDHDPDLLARKVAATGLLRFGGAPILDLDARAPYAVVRLQVLRAVAAAPLTPPVRHAA